MTPYLISFLPIVLYLLLLIYWDAFTVIRKDNLSLCLMWGLILSVFLYFIPLGDFAITKALAEEVLKMLLILVFLRADKMAFLSDAAVYGASVGAGFALGENFFYAYNLVEESALVFVYRGFATSLMHMGMTALAAALFFILLRWRPQSRLSRKETWAFLVAVLPSVLLHFLHNISNLAPENSLAVVIIGVAALFGLFFKLSKERVCDWMETSMAEEVALASALKAGEFSDTPAGQYLLTLKNRLRPQDFFDMLMYVNLFLDLSLQAKRFLMLKEMDITPQAEDVAQYKAKAQELNQLRRNIGRSGLLALRPVVDAKRLGAVINLFK